MKTEDLLANTMAPSFAADFDKFLAALARLFIDKGASAEVAVLTLGRPTFEFKPILTA
jgi:hypothetical protein